MNQTDIKAFIGGLICEHMYMEKAELDADELFSDFGLESVTLAKILLKINEQYKCHIHIEDLLKYQTLNDASTFISESLTTAKIK